MVIEISSDIMNSSRTLNLFRCSIDTRWVRGSNLSSGIPVTDNMVIYGALDSTQNPNTNSTADTDPMWSANSGPNWRYAELDQEWLDVLSPILGGRNTTKAPGWNTVASMLTSAGFDNSTGMVDSWTGVIHTMESAITTLMVDGMSRAGLAANGGNTQHVSDRYGWLQFLDMRKRDSGSYFDRMLRGETVVNPPPGQPEENLTRLRWDVTVSGLSYRADSLAAYLALAVLFTCAVIALCHTASMLITRRSMEAWDCIEELILLSQLSRPSTSAKLANTSGGIHSHSTYRTTVHISEQTEGKPWLYEEKVQLKLDTPEDAL
jgi:hypothetical protein